MKGCSRFTIRAAIVLAMVSPLFAQKDEGAIADSKVRAKVETLVTRRAKVFESGKDGYHTYRIPACVVTKRGTILVFCEGRRTGRGDAGDIDMLVRRSEDGGKTWSPSACIRNDPGNTCGNPCPVVDTQTGFVWLAMTWALGSDHESKVMKGEAERERLVFVTHSEDDGVTWSEPRDITKSVKEPHWRWYALGPCNAIQLERGEHAGRLLFPANHSDHRDATKHPYRSHVFWSDDHGKTWQLGGAHEDRTNESTLVELADGSVLQAMRSYHGKGNRALATSRDGGATWSTVRLEDALRTPVCQASLLRWTWPIEAGIARGESVGSSTPGRILFSSPYGNERSRLTIWWSDDEGRTWPHHVTVDEGAAAYSNLLKLPGVQLGLVYEAGGYASIDLLEFDTTRLFR
ncbi:MAG: exo-alpha-sialidase [Planctomycetes bacterium]|nr:exo-alpha-sialidase [Planctomycetota bacterium]MCB9919109.1 exo-alpha-sialidase [Planctomycetota bacterium]